MENNNESGTLPHALPEPSTGIDEVAVERHKKQQKENMGKFVKGGTDGIGNKIIRVFAKGDEYVIYEIAKCKT